MPDRTPVVKPPKPYPTFPLFAHASGRWAKKIRGKFEYFGSWKDDPKGERALQQFLEEQDTLYAGGRRRRKGEHGPTVVDVCSDYLDAKEKLADNGEITRRSFRDYRETSDFIVENLGKRTLVAGLTPRDFERLRAKLAERLGPTRLGHEVQRIRSVFKFAYESQIIEKPVLFGPGFKKPSLRVLRVQRAKNGERMFSAAEIRKILKASDTTMRAMVLLGANGGMGQSDLAALPIAALDLKGRWCVYPRPKTGINRRIPLWPETTAAIREAIAARPEPKDEPDAGLVFLTDTGLPWVRETREGVHLDHITKRFIRLLNDLGLKRPRVSFYALRHTFQTVADEARDPVAVSSIMGHVASSSDMASVYRQRISDARLLVVTEHVRGWVFGTKGKR